MNLIPPLSVSIAPLQDRHNKYQFASGVPELDRHLQQQAGQDVKRKVAALFVLLDQKETVIGYYTLSSYGIRLAEQPAEMVQDAAEIPGAAGNASRPTRLEPRTLGAKAGPISADRCFEAQLGEHS